MSTWYECGGLWPHLCSVLDVLRLAVELPSHSEKYISKLFELGQSQRPSFSVVSV